MKKLSEKTKDILKLILKLVFVAAVFIAVVVNYDRLVNIDIRALVSGSTSETAAAAGVVGIYALKGMVFVIPASLIYISVGMAFSPLKACIINMLGIAAEVTVSYFFGRFVGGEYVEKLLSKNKGGKKLLSLKEQKKQSSVIAVRFLPVFPIDFTSLFFGSMKMPFLKYLIFSIIGLAPRVLLFTVLGDKVYDLIPMKIIVRVIIAVIPIAVAVFLIKWIVSRKKSTKENENREGVDYGQHSN